MEPWHKGVIYFLVSLVSFPPASFEHFPGRQERLRCLFVWLCMCVCTFIWFRFISWWRWDHENSMNCSWWREVTVEDFLKMFQSGTNHVTWVTSIPSFNPCFQRLSIFPGPMWIVSCGVCPTRWRGLFWCDLTAGKQERRQKVTDEQPLQRKYKLMTAKKKGNQQNFQNRMRETACILDLYVHAWMPYISVCAKNSLFQQVMRPPLWCLACGFLVKAVKQHSITSTDAQMCSARRDRLSMACSC